MNGSEALSPRACRPGKHAAIAAFAALLCLTLPVDVSIAAENGVGIYLLGSKGPFAAILPPQGFYVQSDSYLYSGELSGSRQLPLGGAIVGEVSSVTFLEVPTVVWVTPAELLGGRLGLNASFPLGYPTVDASLSAGPFARSLSDEAFVVGDPIVGGQMAWDSGNLHVLLASLVNVPIGDYREGELANLAFHRWAADFSVAGTWFDPTIGVEASVNLGLTVNGENPVTDYRTGTEFHLEGSLSKLLSPALSLGVVGYYYDQITGDGGEGARLGDFEGKVAALGLTAAYTFEAAGRPISARVKVFQEFAAENRLEGTSGFLTLAVPLTRPVSP